MVGCCFLLIVKPFVAHIISFCREHPAHVIWFCLQLLRLSPSGMCRQYDWCWVTHTHPSEKKTILHIVFLCVPKRGSMIVTWKSELKLLSVNRKLPHHLAKSFIMHSLQALHGRRLQTFPFSFGSLRFASSFKVMRKTLTFSFFTRWDLELQSGEPVNGWFGMENMMVTERRK